VGAGHMEASVHSCFFLWMQGGDTALHAASSGGHVEVMKVLLRAGANPTAVNQVRRLRGALLAAVPAVGGKTMEARSENASMSSKFWP
jgi:ankyrin repeat protein